jgi:hypothetical protein
VGEGPADHAAVPMDQHSGHKVSRVTALQKPTDMRKGSSSGAPRGDGEEIGRR